MKRIAIVFLLCVPVLLLPGYKETLNVINSQIDETQKRLTRLQKEKKSLLNDIYLLELQYKKESIETRKAKLQIERTQQQINEKKREKKVLGRKIETSKKNLRQALRVLYKLGRSAYLKFFISVESFNDLFKNYRLFAALINYKSTEINALKKNILRLERVDKELQDELKKLVTLRKTKVIKLEKTRILKQEKTDLVGKINTDRRTYTILLGELEEEALRLDRLIRGEKGSSGIGPLNLKLVKGKLPWPLRGKVVSTYGKKRSTQFDTYIIDNGIEIKPTSSDRINAVYDGEVIFADYFKGYGNLVIVQHARNFHSLYGHCEEIFKKKGDRVSEGEHIASAGDTGSTYGKSLYLEIRKDLKPENPLQWLRKR